MRAVAEAWRTTGDGVIPLAPSAAAAEVLGAELGCRAENLHKFHHTHDTAPTGRPDDAWFVLQPGDLVLVDEAGMAGTRHLDWLTHYARERGAVVRLLGDPAQLSSVEAGGALRLLAHDAGAVELTDLHRFADPDEAAATLGLRDGDPQRSTSTPPTTGSGPAPPTRCSKPPTPPGTDDTRAGRSSLLIAATGSDVTALNARARTARIAAGRRSRAGVELRDGNRAGVGDLVVTRRNHRRLTSRDGSTLRQERRHLDRRPTGTATATSPSATEQRQPSCAPPRLRRASTSSSATPPPPPAPRAAPSTPPTSSSTTP